jgi:hypothetical protein
MQPLIVVLLLLSIMVPTRLAAQVGEIKTLSSGSSGGHSEGGGGGGGGNVDIFFGVVQMAGMLEVWQREALRSKAENPDIISVEVYLQTAFQPSSYYIVTPRLRGNWGIFSTDFRLNYLLEETLDGVEYLRTTDWQILQLNVLALNNVTFRIGAGIITENFGEKKTYQEWTTAVQLLNKGHQFGGVVEYRWSAPRKEVSAHLQFKLFGTKHFHTFGTAGLMYQRYYSTVDVWGVQTGLLFRIN